MQNISKNKKFDQDFRESSIRPYFHLNGLTYFKIK
jgi:hypothetical protein